MSNPIEYTVKVWDNGEKAWFLNDKRHRIDGPAFENRHGYKEWWLDGKLHRVDGPAVETKDEYNAWYLDGKKYTKKEYDFEIKRRKQPEVIELTVADIEKLLGKKVKIVK